MLGPFVAFFTRIYLDIGYYTVMGAIVLAAFMVQFIDFILMRKKYHFPKYTFYFLLFIGYSIVSDKYLAGKNLNLRYFYENRLISGYLILLMIENAKISYVFIKRYYKVCVGLIVVSLVVILYQQLFDKTFFVYIEGWFAKMFLINRRTFEARLPSIYSWIGPMDISFGFISYTAVVISIKFKGKSKLKYILLWLISALAYSLMAKSRWIMINALFLFVMYPVYIKINLRRFIQYLLISTMLVIVSFSILESLEVPVVKVLRERVLEEQKGGITQGSASSRLIAFIVFAKLFPQNPYFGKGHLHSTSGDSKDYQLVRELAGRSSQIHVGYLSLLYYYGLFGSALFLIFLYQIMRKFYRESRQTHFWGAFFAMMGFVLGNLTLVTFSIFWAGLIVAMIFQRYFMLEYTSKKWLIKDAEENNSLIGIN